MYLIEDSYGCVHALYDSEWQLIEQRKYAGFRDWAAAGSKDLVYDYGLEDFELHVLPAAKVKMRVFRRHEHAQFFELEPPECI